jgi:hypothetical protein
MIEKKKKRVDYLYRLCKEYCGEKAVQSVANRCVLSILGKIISVRWLCQAWLSLKLGGFGFLFGTFEYAMILKNWFAV